MVYVISFIFWLVFGSFISVLVWRIKNKEKWILFGRSKCPKCWNALQPVDLVPIFSYIFLKWKCRYCWEKISIIYPILELTTGLVFVFVSWLILQTGNIKVFLENWQYVVYGWLVGVFFVALAFYDILFYEISFILVWILAILLLVPQILWIVGDWKLALILAISGFVVFLGISFLRLKVRKIEGMWGGDAIWAAILGLLTPILMDILGLHYPAWLVFYVLIMMGFGLGALVWLFGLFWKKMNFLSKLPFLPFMFGAVILFAIFGKEVLGRIIN